MATVRLVGPRPSVKNNSSPRSAQNTAKGRWGTGFSGGNPGYIGRDQMAKNRRKSMAEAGIEPARELPPTGF
ncbi:MAG: hypothetical protein KDA60_01255, partial [Planctomycetales bacterium]|nr:hypothetical protein [Planctomycetales bacterium]